MERLWLAWFYSEILVLAGMLPMPDGKLSPPKVPNAKAYKPFGHEEFKGLGAGAIKL